MYWRKWISLAERKRSVSKVSIFKVQISSKEYVPMAHDRQSTLIAEGGQDFYRAKRLRVAAILFILDKMNPASIAAN
jgi:hypothetical protein